MDFVRSPSVDEDNEAIIVKADEVDEAGADISTISPTDASESEFNARIETRRAQDSQSSGSPKILANTIPSPSKTATRPILRREGSTPAPPQQPPPPAPPQSQEDSTNATDSLSLQQLKRLVNDLPKLEPTAYAYQYSETRSFPEELEEWFSYTEEERYMLLRAKQTFEDKWEQAQAGRPDSSNQTLEWTDVEQEDRESFIVGAIEALESPEISSRAQSLECISYVALGSWGDTAGVVKHDEDISLTEEDTKWIASRNTKPKTQLSWIWTGTVMLCKCGVLEKLLKILQTLSRSEQDAAIPLDRPASYNEKVVSSISLRQIELNQTLLILYVIVEAGRWQRARNKDTSSDEVIVAAMPALLAILTQIIAKLRWEEDSHTPMPKVILLFWKSALLSFGSFSDVKSCKAALCRKSDAQGNAHDESFITASPLDYHLFRQEITSKYPAYNPPPPLVPIEDQNNSILPPLSTHPSRRASQENLQPVATDGNSTSGSIFYQPVHIATPAPSPPPSPGGPGGKGGKKQNYQTNQNFPFLYPPLDDASNSVSGESNADLQDKLVGERWASSAVPASILEAGQLFASRMRMSRSIRQLWDVREKYVKSERSWNGRFKNVGDPKHGSRKTNTEDAAESDSDGLVDDDSSQEDCDDVYTDEEDDLADEMTRKRLDNLNDFYRGALPSLQSFVMVLWRILFGNVSALVAQNGQNGLTNGFPEDGDPGGRKRPNTESSANLDGLANGQLANDEERTDPVVEELNAVRSREITSKAVSGVLLLLLKWFKLSHILKYEYLSQLLLDANYIPLILKFFAHQDVDRAVDQKNDREDLDFFNFCRLNSKHPPTSPPQPTLSPSSSSEDEAAPPPILKHRRSPTSQSPPHTPPQPAARPEVDELGYPTTGALPKTPLTNYAPRFFLTNINFLRLLQKITKRKAHRALLLVQYKTSTILRKALKIPQPDLRLYTLKLFKSQVPYCGRKWRQTNMRVITAIYLHCRPELRDEWLCGGDVDGVVEEAVPLEQAGRSLVHWWHLKEFKDVMEGSEVANEGKNGDKDDEYDFFARELEKMGWGLGAVGAADEEEAQEGGEPAAPNEFEGGPLAMEGWA